MFFIHSHIPKKPIYLNFLAQLDLLDLPSIICIIEEGSVHITCYLLVHGHQSAYYLCTLFTLWEVLNFLSGIVRFCHFACIFGRILLLHLNLIWQLFHGSGYQSGCELTDLHLCFISGRLKVQILAWWPAILIEVLHTLFQSHKTS
jgi:hypothetical protein